MIDGDTGMGPVEMDESSRQFLDEAKKEYLTRHARKIISRLREDYDNEKKAKLLRHKENKLRDVGSSICCANCGKVIVKKDYQTQYCSNKGSGNCKDSYWNVMNPARMIRYERLVQARYDKIVNQ